MQTESIPLNGLENRISDNKAIQALTQFYQAFNTRDLALMERNWLHSDEASLCNPLGGLRRGWQQIQPLYQALFTGAATVYVEYHDYSIHQYDKVFLCVGRERGYFRLDDTDMPLAIRTSRTFTRTSQGWKQLHHHGSIDDAACLQQYQRAVLKQSTQE